MTTSSSFAELTFLSLLAITGAILFFAFDLAINPIIEINNSKTLMISKIIQVDCPVLIADSIDDQTILAMIPRMETTRINFKKLRNFGLLIIFRL